MIKIDMAMPSTCLNCSFGQIAYDSDLFEDGEPYCCIKSESVKVNMDSDTKPVWCPLIDNNSTIERLQSIMKDESIRFVEQAVNAAIKIVNEKA